MGTYGNLCELMGNYGKLWELNAWELMGTYWNSWELMRTYGKFMRGNLWELRAVFALQGVFTLRFCASSSEKIFIHEHTFREWIPDIGSHNRAVPGE